MVCASGGVLKYIRPSGIELEEAMHEDAAHFPQVSANFKQFFLIAILHIF